MIRFQTIITTFLLAAWLPVSSHALLEYAGLIHERHADHHADSQGSHEHDSDNHEAADGKCASSFAHVSVPVLDLVTSPFLFCALGLEWASEFHTESHPLGLPPPGTAPPRFSHHWQFSFRTALPARAPSLIS